MLRVFISDQIIETLYSNKACYIIYRIFKRELDENKKVISNPPIAYKIYRVFHKFGVKLKDY